eukprot:GGOE01045979.1.p1 GENE.GGOE01045979.1~~GGOE01045979.1.p1  ORF type:complete len:880 (-),score=149.71 GGOE01045979.1:189-2465(-)
MAQVEWCEMNLHRRGTHCEFYFKENRPMDTVSIEDAILEWDVPVEQEDPGRYILPRAHMERLLCRTRELQPMVALIGEGAEGPEVWLGQVAINAHADDLDCYYLDREPNSTTLYRMSTEISTVHRSAIIDSKVPIKEVPRRQRLYSISEEVLDKLQASLKQEVKARAELDRGVSLMEAGKHAEAFAAFATAEELMVGGKAEVHINRACLYVRQGKLDLAVEQLKLAVECHTQPDDFEAEKDLEPLKSYAPAREYFHKQPPTIPQIPPPARPITANGGSAVAGAPNPHRSMPAPREHRAPKPAPRKRLQSLRPTKPLEKRPKPSKPPASRAKRSRRESSSSSGSDSDSSSSSSSSSSSLTSSDECMETTPGQVESANGLLHPHPAAPRKKLVAHPVPSNTNHCSRVASASAPPAAPAAKLSSAPPSASQPPPPPPQPTAPILPPAPVPDPQPDDAALELSAAAWNQFWQLPGAAVGIGWRFLPPLMDVKEFLLVEQPHFPPGKDLSDPIVFRPSVKQKTLLRDPRIRVWVGEYSAANCRFLRWNIFVHFVVNGVKLSWDSYKPQTHSPKNYHASILVDLLAAEAKVKDAATIQIQFWKDVQSLQKLKRPSDGEACSGDLCHVALCIGHELQPDEFVHQRRERLPMGFYRTPIGEQVQEDDLTCMWYGLSFKDPITLMRIQHPVRGKNCDHLACFDLSTLLMQSKEHRTLFDWACGICKRPMPGLVYDSEVHALLQRHPTLTEIRVDLARWGEPDYFPDS